MMFGSTCSGIDAASVAWNPLGWRAAFLSEIDKFPSAVLAHHYPDVPNLGDMTKFKDWPDADIDVLVGGTPCQSFSVAGLRKGLADPRGNLALTYLGCVDRYRPEWFIWENVPGVLSLDGGRAFGSILGGMAELGYGFAYRVLDAQFVRVDGYGRAVPQRRRRVFVVGNSRSWRRAAAVLFERESLSWDSAPRREAGQGIAAGALAGTSPGGGWRVGADEAAAGQLVVASTLDASYARLQGCSGQDLNHGHSHLIPFGGNNASGPIDVATAVNAHGGPAGRLDFESETFVATRAVAATLTRGAESQGKGGYAGRRQEDDTNIIAIQERAISENPDAGPDGIGVRQDGAAYTLEARQVPQAIAFDAQQSDVIQYGDKTGPLDTDGHTMAVQQGWAVRRLTPTECERLQGFPDGYTNIPWRGKEASDGPRYKALGNSMAVNAMRWLGRRIEMVERIAAEDIAEAAE